MMNTNNIQCETYVCGIQSGFACGLVKSGTGTRMVERIVRVPLHASPIEYDQANAAAETVALTLLHEYRNRGTKHIPDFGPMPGDLYDVASTGGYHR